MATAVNLTVIDPPYKREVWRVTVHYESGDHAQDFDILDDAMKWSGIAIRQMGWPNRNRSKVTVERVAV